MKPNIIFFDIDGTLLIEGYKKRDSFAYLISLFNKK